MRVLRKYLFPLMAALMLVSSSCSSDDYELYKENGKTETWEYELRNIVSDFGFLFENSGVKFLQAEELRHRVDSTDFFNDETCFPVCIKKLYNFFMLKDNEFVNNDTITIHTPSFILKGMVNNVVKDQDKYVFVRLTWLLGERKFQTVAAFDKSNGQIVYDNILTNIPLSQVELPSKKSKLTRAEGGSGTETKIFFKDIMSVPAGNNYYELWVKGICHVTVTGNGVYSNPVFSLVQSKTVFPPDLDPNNPNATHCYPVADAYIYNNDLYYYVWVGINEDTYTAHSFSKSTNESRKKACIDIWDLHMDSQGSNNNCINTNYDIGKENIYMLMGMGLFEPEPSYHPEWNF